MKRKKNVSGVGKKFTYKKKGKSEMKPLTTIQKLCIKGFSEALYRGNEKF